MKKISTLFLIILCICAALMLASCGEHTHNFSADEGTVIIEPTCMYEGKLVRTCECGKTKVETLDKLVHSYSDTISYDNAYHYYACTTEKCTSVSALAEHEWVKDDTATVAATCNSIGSETYNCACGATKTVNLPQIREHVWDAGVDTPATCIATGVKTYTCTICKETKTEELPLVPHVFATTYTTNETHHYYACTTPGCEEIKEDSKAEHVWDAGTVTKAPNCMEVGEMTYKCTECETTKTEEIQALPHVFSVDLRSNGVYHYHYCTNPGCTAIDGNTAHTWNNGEVTSAPTEDENGSVKYTCTVCGRTKTEEVIYHAYSAWTYDEEKHYKKCTVKGHTDIIEEGAHEWSDFEITVYPTPTMNGEVVYSCKCGAKDVRPVIYEAPSANLSGSAAWNEAFAEGKFANVILEGSFATENDGFFYAGVMLEGNNSLEKTQAQDGIIDVYYSVEDGVNYVYTYNAEANEWSKAESEFAYTESYFLNLFNAKDKYFDFVFVVEDATYEAENITIGTTEYINVSYRFHNGNLVEVSATLKDEVNLFGKAVKSFEVELYYGESSVTLPTLPAPAPEEN